MCDTWEEQSFELRDPYINTRMAIILEIDQIVLSQIDKKDISIKFIEKKLAAKNLSKDILKMWGTVSTYVLRPFTVEYREEEEKETRDKRLRRVLPETNLYLNLLIACADYGTMHELASGVTQSLQVIRRKTDSNDHPILVEALELLINKAEWLRSATSQTVVSGDIISPEDVEKELGLFPEELEHIRTLLITIGTMDSIVEDSTVKTINKYLEKSRGSVEQVFLIHTAQSSENAESIKKRLDCDCQLVNQETFEGQISSLESPIALFLTYYPQVKITQLIEKLNTVDPSACLFTSETYTYRVDEAKQRPDTIFHLMGRIEDFQGV